MPINYNNAKVYAIRSHNSDEVFIGSTTQTLSKRLADHNTKYRKFLKGTYKKNMKAFGVIKLGNCYIELLQKYPSCSCIEELTQYTNEHMRKNKCVNTPTKNEAC